MNMLATSKLNLVRSAMAKDIQRFEMYNQCIKALRKDLNVGSKKPAHHQA